MDLKDGQDPWEEHANNFDEDWMHVNEEDHQANAASALNPGNTEADHGHDDDYEQSSGWQPGSVNNGPHNPSYLYGPVGHSIFRGYGCQSSSTQAPVGLGLHGYGPSSAVADESMLQSSTTYRSMDNENPQAIHDVTHIGSRFEVPEHQPSFLHPRPSATPSELFSSAADQQQVQYAQQQQQQHYGALQEKFNAERAFETENPPQTLPFTNLPPASLPQPTHFPGNTPPMDRFLVDRHSGPWALIPSAGQNSVLQSGDVEGWPRMYSNPPYSTLSHSETMPDSSFVSMSTRPKSGTTHTTSIVVDDMGDSFMTVKVPEGKATSHRSSGASHTSEDFDPVSSIGHEGGYETHERSPCQNLAVPEGRFGNSSIRAPSPSPSNVSRCTSNASDVYPCSERGCRSSFKGLYGRGNFQRHMRQKHGIKVKEYSCEVATCPKVFLRPDARLKHYRKHHPELNPPPKQRRK